MTRDEARAKLTSMGIDWKTGKKIEKPGLIQTMSNAAGKIQGTMPYVAGLMSPSLGLGYKYAEEQNKASGKLGESVAEFAGKHQVNPILSAILGTGAEIGSNPMTYMAPEGKVAEGKIFEPTIPPERQAGVAAAREIGMPLRRGEMSGGKTSTGLSNLMQKTVLGAGPEEKFTARQMAALDAAKKDLSVPGVEPYSAGTAAKAGMGERDAAMAAKRNALFDNVPDNVYIKLNQAKKVADTLTDEQSKLYAGTRSPEVTRWAKIVSDAESSQGKGVTGGPEVHGVTTTFPEQVIPPSTRNVRSSLLSPTGGPLSFEQEVPGRTIPESKEYGVKYSVGQEDKFAPKPNYFPVKKMRENLGEAIGQAKESGRYQDFRDLTRLKAGLDADIETFAKQPATALDSFVAKEFKASYQKANAFSGAYKGLFKSDEAKALAEAPPEKVVDMVFKKNNETAIKQFHALVGEKGFAPAKQLFTKELLESNNVTKELDKYEEGTLRSIYNQKELNALRNYGKAQGIQKTVGNLPGTQGSARTNVHAGQYAGLGAGIMEGLRGNLPGAAVGVGQFAAPALISRLNLATAEGIPYSLGGKSANALAGATSGIGGGKKRDVIMEAIRKLLGQ